MTTIHLDPGHLTLDHLNAIHSEVCQLVLPEAARGVVRASHALVKAAAEGDAPVYGVNTGFGKLANKRIDKDQLATLQRNLIRSHSVGVGEPLAAPIMRLMMATKAASLARGYSGCREIVIDTLLAVHNAGLVPCVPSQGSVGASGDLAPASTRHIGQARSQRLVISMIGRQRCCSCRVQKPQPSGQGLEGSPWKPRGTEAGFTTRRVRR